MSKSNSDFKNPWLAGKAELNERYGSYVSAARNWRVIGVMSLLVALTSVSGLVYLSGQNRIIPYVVEVDKLGSAVAVSPATQAPAPERTVIVSSLSRWIADVRSIYTDADALRALLKEGYALVNQHSDAYGALNDHMRARDPFKRAESETVSVAVQSVLPIAGDAWRIEWREETRGRDGSKPTSQQYQATVQITIHAPSDEATIRVNPFGIYITSFSWAQRL